MGVYESLSGWNHWHKNTWDDMEMIQSQTELIKSITWEIIISKADIDFQTDIDKREHADKLEKIIKELMR